MSTLKNSHVNKSVRAAPTRFPMVLAAAVSIAATASTGRAADVTVTSIYNYAGGSWYNGSWNPYEYSPTYTSQAHSFSKDSVNHALYAKGTGSVTASIFTGASPLMLSATVKGYGEEDWISTPNDIAAEGFGIVSVGFSISRPMAYTLSGSLVADRNYLNGQQYAYLYRSTSPSSYIYNSGTLSDPTRSTPIAASGVLTTGSYYSETYAQGGTYGNSSFPHFDYGYTETSINLTLSPIVPISWQKTTGGFWGSTANWQYSFVPDANNDVTFGLVNTYAVNFTAAASAKALTVSNGNVTFNLDGNTLTTAAGNDVLIGGGSGTPASLTINNGTLESHGTTHVGLGNPNAVLIIGANGLLSIDGAYNLRIAEGGGTGTVTVGGTNSRIQVASAIVIAANGSGGSGTLTANAGSLVTAGALDIGPGGSRAGVLNVAGGTVQIAGTTTVYNSNSIINLTSGTLKTGSLNLGGDGSRLNWTAAGTIELTNSPLVLGSATFTNRTFGLNDLHIHSGRSLIVSGYGQSISIGAEAGQSSTLTINQGGQVTFNNSNTAYVGFYGPGTINLSDAGSKLDVAGNIHLGYFASSTGVLSVSPGAQAAANWINVGGLEAGAHGTLNVPGGTVNITTGGGLLTVGQAGIGTFTLSAGGTLSALSSRIGVTSTATGTATIGGAGSTWNNAALYLGGTDSANGNGTGTVTINAGGTVNVTGPTKVWNNASKINLTGGTLRTGILDTANTASRFYDNWTGGTLELTSTTNEIHLDANGPLGTNSISISNGAQLITNATTVIGNNVPSVMTVFGGATFVTKATAQSVIVGNVNADGSSLTISGIGSSWTIDGLNSVRIGAYSNASLTVQNGGTVTSQIAVGAGTNDISGLGTGHGTINVTGNGSSFSALQLALGSIGATTGVLNVSAGAAVTIDGLTATNTPGSQINLSGGTLKTGTLDLGGVATRLNWTSGTLDLTNSDLSITTGGTLGSSLTTSATKLLRVSGTGRTLTIASGGTLTSASLLVGGTPSGTDQVYASGVSISGGYTTIAGTTKITAGSTLTINNNTSSLRTGTLDTSNTPTGLNWTDGLLELTNSSLTIGPGGTIGASLTATPTKHLGVSGLGQTLTVAAGGSLSSPSLHVGGGYGAPDHVYARGAFIQTGGTTTITGLANAEAAFSLSGGSFTAQSLYLHCPVSFTGGTINITGGIFDANDLNFAGPTAQLHILAGSGYVNGVSTNSDSSHVFLTPSASVFDANSPAITRRVANGTTFAGLGAQADGDLNTRADLVGGKAAGQRDVVMKFRTRSAVEVYPGTGGNFLQLPAGLFGDVLRLTGMNNGGAAVNGRNPADVFALQMSYDASLVPDTSNEGTLSLGWLDTGDGNWKNAIAGNFYGGDANGDSILDGAYAVHNYANSYSAFALLYGVTDLNISNYLGSYGVDTAGDMVWAVLNHNSDFSPIPEPASLMMLALGTVALLGRRRR